MNILILDDHPIFATGIDLLFKSANTGLKSYSKTSLLKLRDCSETNSLKIDLILLDLYLNKDCWTQNFERLKRMYPGVPVAIISSCDNPQIIKGAMKSGINGFVPKSLPADQLLLAILKILDGEIYTPNFKTLGKTLQTLDSSPTRNFDLSRRQKEILSLISEGKSVKLIAFELEISESTIKSHLSFIYKCLNVKNKAEAIKYYKNNLVS